MADPKQIFLEPECCADCIDGRRWCEDDVFEECDDGGETVRYIRADLVKEAFKPITMQDIRLCTGEGDLRSQDVFSAVNIILKQRLSRLTLA